MDHEWTNEDAPQTRARTHDGDVAGDGTVMDSLGDLVRRAMGEGDLQLARALLDLAGQRSR